MLAIVRNAALALALVLAISAPPAADASEATPTKATVASVTLSGPCHGGGHVRLVAEAAGDGWAVTLTATKLVDGDHWRGGLSIESEDTGESDGASFRRTVVDGGWTVTKQLDDIDDPSFSAPVFGPGPDRPDMDHLCSVYVTPVKPLVGVTSCRGSLNLALGAVRTSDSTMVRWFAYGAKPLSGWTIAITASTDEGGTGQASSERANRNGVMLGKTSFDVVEPRLSLTAEADGGQKCTMRIHRSLTPN